MNSQPRMNAHERECRRGGDQAAARDRRSGWNRVAVICLLSSVVSAAVLAASHPGWWTARGVLNTNANVATNDFAPATQGQLKWLATKAAEELEASLPGGAGSNVALLVAGLPTNNNCAPVNIGQAKNVAKPIYDQLMAYHFVNGYPWTMTASDDNDFAPANIGQVKNLFAFDLTKDSDGDGIPDDWETANSLNPNDPADANYDPQGNGLTALLRFQAGVSVTGILDFVDATLEANYEQRTVSSRRYLPSEGIQGFEATANYYRGVSLSGAATWIIYRWKSSAEGTNVQEKGAVANVSIPLTWVTNNDMNCKPVWDVNGATLNAWREQYDTNGTMTSRVDLAWSWNSRGEWANEAGDWQSGAAATVTCSACGTFYPQSPLHLNLAPSNAAKESDTYAEWDWPHYSADLGVTDACATACVVLDSDEADGQVAVTLGSPVTISDITNEVRADVSSPSALAACPWGADATVWVQNNSCAVLPCGGVAAYDQDEWSAAARRGEYRFTLATSSVQAVYLVTAAEVKYDLVTGATSHVFRRFLSQGTGNVLHFNRATVELPHGRACVEVQKLYVRIQDYGTCWSDGGAINLADTDKMSPLSDAITANNLKWTVWNASGSQGSATLQPAGSDHLVFGQNGGQYLVTAKATAFPGVEDTATLKVVRVSFDTNSVIVPWSSNGWFDASARLRLPQSGPTGWTWTATTLAGAPLATSVYLFATNGGEYEIKATSKECTSCCDTMTLYVIKIETTTFATEPTDRTRKVIAVGEPVQLKVTPTSLAPVQWSVLNGNGTLSSTNSNPTVFTAPDNAATENTILRANLQVGRCDVTFQIMEPQRLVYDNLCPMGPVTEGCQLCQPADQDIPGANSGLSNSMISLFYKADFYILPDTVNFGKIELFEGSASSVDIGVFTNYPGIHSPNGPTPPSVHVVSGKGTHAGVDRIGCGPFLFPFAESGTATFAIDDLYQVPTVSTNIYRFATVEQLLFASGGTNGSLSVKKQGSGYTISGPGGIVTESP